MTIDFLIGAIRASRDLHPQVKTELEESLYGKEPIEIGYGTDVPYPYRCGRCKCHIRKGQRYCDMCGGAVRWDG